MDLKNQFSNMPQDKPNDPLDIKEEYLHTMHKDIARLEEGQLEEVREQILAGRPHIPPAPPPAVPSPPPEPTRPTPPPIRPPVLRPRPIVPPKVTLPTEETEALGPRTPLVFDTKETKKETIPPQKRPPAPRITPAREMPAPPPIVPPAYYPTRPFWESVPLVVPFAILFLIWAVFGFWFFFVWKPKGEEQQPLPQQMIQQEVPAPLPPPEQPLSLIPVDETIEHEVQSPAEVKEHLVTDLTTGRRIPGALQRIVFLVERDHYLTLNEFFETNLVNIPDILKEEFTGSYTLFIYRQQEGPRLGFVASIKSPLQIEPKLILWESTMVEDTQNLFALLGKERDVGPFRSTTYRGIKFRYYDFLPERLGIVYTIDPVRNMLIFTTSGEALIELLKR